MNRASTGVHWATRLAVGYAVLVMFAGYAGAATIFINGSSTFPTVTKTTVNCPHTADTFCASGSTSACTCYTATSPLVEQNLDKIEAGSYTVYLEILSENDVAPQGVCSAGAYKGQFCLTSDNCGQICADTQQVPCQCIYWGCNPGGTCSNDASKTCSKPQDCGCAYPPTCSARGHTVSCSSPGTVCTLHFCAETVNNGFAIGNTSSTLCSSDLSCGGTPACEYGKSVSYRGGYALIKNVTTGHTLTFTFSSAAGKQPATVGSDMKSVSAAAGMVSGTGPFSLYAGELDFSIAIGGTLAKGGAAAAPAMELSVTGGLHSP